MQGELFNLNTSGPVTDASRFSQAQPGWLDRFQVTLRLDHLSILTISALVLYVLVFSFGVEKGKGVALREMEAAKKRREEINKELAQMAPLPPFQEAKEKIKEEREGITQTPSVETSLVDPPRSNEAPPLLVGKYTIQVITYTSQSRAREEVKKLTEKGYRSFVISGGKFHQVCVEAFEDMSTAREKLIQLRSQGFAPPDAYIRPLKGTVSI